MEVAAVGDGKAALSQWVGRVPDAVVLDLTLPGLDGLQVLQRARALGLRTPVLILTARGTVGDRVMGLNAGADDYLPKPFDLDELEARLRALVRRSADPWRHASGQQYHADWRHSLRQGQWRPVPARRSHGADPARAGADARAAGAAGHAVTKERLYELVFPGQLDVQYEAIEVGGGVPAAQNWWERA